MHGNIKDMKSQTIVDICRSEKFFGVHRGYDLTTLFLMLCKKL